MGRKYVVDRWEKWGSDWSAGAASVSAFWRIWKSTEDEWVRHNKAVAAETQYCGFQEGGLL